MNALGLAYSAEESARLAFEAIGGDSSHTNSADPFTIALYGGNDAYEAWLCARAAVRFEQAKEDGVSP